MPQRQRLAHAERPAAPEVGRFGSALDKITGSGIAAAVRRRQLPVKLDRLPEMPHHLPVRERSDN